VARAPEIPARVEQPEEPGDQQREVRRAEPGEQVHEEDRVEQREAGQHELLQARDREPLHHREVAAEHAELKELAEQLRRHVQQRGHDRDDRVQQIRVRLDPVARGRVPVPHPVQHALAVAPGDEGVVHGEPDQQERQQHADERHHAVGQPERVRGRGRRALGRAGLDRDRGPARNARGRIHGADVRTWITAAAYDLP
jgi:hypothetical protein